MEPQSEKNQVVKHGKYGSIIPRTFSLENHNSQVLPLVKRGLLSRVLKYICKICLHSNYLYGVLKNSKGGGGIIQISQKEELSLIKTKYYLGQSHLAPFLPAPSKKDLFPSVWPSREYTWALIWKNLSGLFQSTILTGRVERV